MIAMPETTIDFAAIVERLGGWGAFLVFLWIGWRQFMALANQFSSGVLSKLDGIKDVLSGHERRLDRIDDKLDQIEQAQTSYHNQKHPR